MFSRSTKNSNASMPLKDMQGSSTGKQCSSVVNSAIKSRASAVTSVRDTPSNVGTKTSTAVTRPSRSKRKSRTAFVMDDKSEMALKEDGYEIKERLGMGAFSEVFHAYNTKRGFECAAKVIDQTAVNEKFQKKFLVRELKTLCRVRHEYIIRVYDIFRMSNHIFIFMELAKGDLAHYIKPLRGPMEERHACKWFYQMASALQYLHSIKVAHRDIKIDNVLIAVDNCAKLTDFGFSLLVSEESQHSQLSQTFCGTRPYLSPQLNQKQPYLPFKADIWALAVVLFAMLNHRYPFHYKDKKIMIAEQLNPDYIAQRFHDSMSADSKDLLLAMFQPDESQRATADQIIEHAWVTNCYDPNLQIKVHFTQTSPHHS